MTDFFGRAFGACLRFRAQNALGNPLAEAQTRFFGRAFGAHSPFATGTVLDIFSKKEPAARWATPSGSVIFIGKMPMPTL